MHKQCGFRCEYTVLNFLGRAASLRCLAVEHLELDAHTQAFARSDLWGLTDFAGHKGRKLPVCWEALGAVSLSAVPPSDLLSQQTVLMLPL